MADGDSHALPLGNAVDLGAETGVQSDAEPHPRLHRAAIAFAIAGAVASAIAAVAYVIATLHTRRWGQVEAEMVFEAMRVRSGFPLYFDPVAGAHEYGDPPTRYFVLYTPVWPRVLSWLGSSLDTMRFAGRAFNSVVWLSFLAFVLRSAPKANRAASIVAVGLACGCFFMSRETTLACADTTACVLAGLGLLRAVKKREMDWVAAALLASGPFWKPNVLGIAIGVCLAHLLVKRFQAWRSLAVFAFVGLSWLAVCRFASGGLFPLHMLRATGQTLSLERAAREIMGRGFFLLLPHVVVLFFAFRARAGMFARVALSTTVAWSTFLSSKHGSGAHYFVEPTVAAIVVVTQTEWSGLGASRMGAVLRYATAGVFAWIVFGSSIDAFADDAMLTRQRKDLVAQIRDACPLGAGDVLVSTDVVMELEIDGRIIVPVWQNTYLLRTGVFPADVWRRDLASPHVKCLLSGLDMKEPLPQEIAGITEVGAFRKELRETIDANFALDREVGGWLVYKRR
jgi:hypothetical protein